MSIDNNLIDVSFLLCNKTKIASTIPNHLSYTQLANAFSEVYNDNSQHPDNQRQNFVLRLCGDHKEIYEIPKNILDKMTNIYKNNISDK